MNKLKNSNLIDKIINDINKKNFNNALDNLKKISEYNSNKNLITKLYAFIYFNKKNWVKAIEYYKKILDLEKEKFKIYINIGVAYFKLGKINQSITVFKKSLYENPNSTLAHNNIGISYLEIGMYQEALNHFILASKLNKNDILSQKNLLKIFNLFTPSNNSDHKLVMINKKISELINNYKIKNLNKLTNIKIILNESDKLIKEFDKNLFLNETQIYRQNATNLNCNRHFKIFNKFNIIPKHCFSCYKVQINLMNVVDLIRVYFIFDNLYLEKNNIRKCIVEMRDNVIGNYKSYIYCNGIEEAKLILNLLDKKLKKEKLYTFKISIKHGCSEFYESYPEYEKINFNGKQEMNYNETWINKENIIDNQIPRRLDIDKKVFGKSIRGINLSDILIIKNWMSYADTIGDYSYKLIFDKLDKNILISNLLKGQLNFRKKA